MSEDFYPFVDSGDPAPDNSHLNGVREDAPMQAEDNGQVGATYTTRISVYDDLLSTPRVIMIERDDVRTYLEEITNTVYRTMKEQGGNLSLMIIRELVENFIHAHFTEPVISILDGGNTIRFADQGPGIGDKERAFEFGVTSASRDQKRYIRGTGSGLPMVQQYVENAGGAISIEDNLNQGTVVTVSVDPQRSDAIRKAAARGAAVRSSAAVRSAPTETAPGGVAGAAGFQGQAGAAGAYEYGPQASATPASPYDPQAAIKAANTYEQQVMGALGASPYDQQGAGTHGAGMANPLDSQAAGMNPNPHDPAFAQTNPAIMGANPYGVAPGQMPYGYPSPTSTYPAPGAGYPGQMPAYPTPGYPYQTPPQGSYQQFGHQFSTIPQQGFPPAGFSSQGAWGQPAASPWQAGPEVGERGALALQFLAQAGQGGPTDLMHAYGKEAGSVPTWSRELDTLSSYGLARKRGQKYVITDMGQAWLHQHQ